MITNFYANDAQAFMEVTKGSIKLASHSNLSQTLLGPLPLYEQKVNADLLPVDDSSKKWLKMMLPQTTLDYHYTSLLRRSYYNGEDTEKDKKLESISPTSDLFRR